MTHPPFTAVMARVAAAELRVLDLLGRVEWLTVTQLAAEAGMDQWVVRWAALRLRNQRMLAGGHSAPGQDDVWRITRHGAAVLRQLARGTGSATTPNTKGTQPQ
ncbi:hypothetical protein [Nocardia sp. BMG51109]|uniref:hypothetical protein n=1 Tax=Nocardia sp. BMG51109 TaxID=1056816 RepID=UPI0004665FA9|nr:hypothetical protein [Nocardia sp. BMG51109]